MEKTEEKVKRAEGKKEKIGEKRKSKKGEESEQNLPFYLIVHQHEVVNDMYENKLCDFHE